MNMAVSILSKLAMSLLSEELAKTVALIALRRVLEWSEKDADSELNADNKKIYETVCSLWGREP